TRDHLEATTESETVFTESQLADIEPSSSLTVVRKNIEYQDQVETAGCELIEGSEPQVQLESSAEPEEDMHVQLEAVNTPETSELVEGTRD
ncbi:PREDICTED: chromatin structure-remodeling complex protein SYD-like, partial [Camelina sativa]|uniref:Chromatin structure-remodeling complex protein SYD-like n=1 Tax=Camelina sativa TaxID=90675 RepID=A0ABM1RIB9_CAMSA